MKTEKEEKNNIWLDQYIELKNKVVNRICELVKDEIISLENFPYNVNFQDNYSSEYLSLKPLSISGSKIKLKNPYDDSENAITEESLSDFDLSELVSICDFLEVELT